MKQIYESPKMFAEVFVPNQYVAACEESFENIPRMEVKCTSKGHDNIAINNMFTDSNNDCTAKYNPGVGDEGSDGLFHTQFEACDTVVGCNRYNYEEHGGRYSGSGDWHWHGIQPCAWIMHDTEIDLSEAQKYQLS